MAPHMKLCCILTLFVSYEMYDFSAFQFSSTKTGLCIAILCFALLAGLADLFRIHTIFRTAPNVAVKGSAKTRFLDKWSGNLKREVDWEIRPLTGKGVSVSVLTVPILAIGLIASTSIGADRKLSAITTGKGEGLHSLVLIIHFDELTPCFSCVWRPPILRCIWQ